jgi:hypothetical protein
MYDAALGRALTVGILAITACSEPDGCTLELRYAIDAQVRDATTHGLLTNYPHGVVQDGAFEDSLRAVGDPADPAIPSELVAAGERPGSTQFTLRRRATSLGTLPR